MQIIDMQSWGSSEPNEDRAGNACGLAWVIDGATDLVDAPLVGRVSDAAWLAETSHAKFTKLAADAPPHLYDFPAMVNQELAVAFEKCARRKPDHPWEYPSAAALIVREAGNQLEWVGLGDCALIAESNNSLTTIGVGGADAGDRRTAAEVSRLQQLHGLGSEAERRALIWPQLRLVRAACINRPGGNAVLSITPPPKELIEYGTIDVTQGGYALLATDGLMRLIDIYERYDARSLLDVAKSLGIEALLRELRQVENDDANCAIHPRVKQSDDATGLLLRFP